MRNFLVVCFICSFSGLSGQDMDSIMQSLSSEESRPVLSTFKSPKLVLLQTNETLSDNNLVFWIGHRFGDIGGESGGSHTLYGLDASTDIHIAFDYGITDDFTIGIGRSKFWETYNLQAKYRLLLQQENKFPVAVTLFGQSSWITREEFVTNEFPEETDRISHFLQVILARKISPSLSLMLNPGYLFRSHITTPGDQEDFFVLGMGGRIKLTKRFSIIADYVWVQGFDRPDDLSEEYFNPLGIGLEIETGGHVFSLNFQNAPYITANNFIPYTQKSWTDGGVRFGFSISRNFFLGDSRRNIKKQ